MGDTKDDNSKGGLKSKNGKLIIKIVAAVAVLLVLGAILYFIYEGFFSENATSKKASVANDSADGKSENSSKSRVMLLNRSEIKNATDVGDSAFNLVGRHAHTANSN